MFQPGRFFRGILIAAVASAPSAIAWAASGSEIFADVCAACHGAAGEGKASLAPPLKGSAFVKSSSADAIAANQRPASMAEDEATVYDFVTELLATGHVSDGAFKRVKDAFGERGVVDLVGAVGYYSLVSMTLNVAQVPLPEGVTPPLKA